MREFINTLSSLHQYTIFTLHLARSSDNPVALLSWRRPARWLVGLLTSHLWVVRALWLLELDSALLPAIVIRIPAILLLLRWAVRRRWCRSTAVVVPALLSLLVVVDLVMLLAAILLAGKPSRAVAWCEALLAAAAGVDASEEVLVRLICWLENWGGTHEQANARTRKKPTMTTSATQRPQRFQFESFLYP
jgi:hypothetical protein